MFPETPRTLQQYDMEGFNGGPQLITLCRETPASRTDEGECFESGSKGPNEGFGQQVAYPKLLAV